MTHYISMSSGLTAALDQKRQGAKMAGDAICAAMTEHRPCDCLKGVDASARFGYEVFTVHDALEAAIVGGLEEKFLQACAIVVELAGRLVER